MEPNFHTEILRGIPYVAIEMFWLGALFVVMMTTLVVSTPFGG